MDFKPLEKMWERVEVERQNSDADLFLSLLYTGEMLTKVITAGLVAAVSDDRDKNRYRLAYRLVRADGIGEWSQVIDDVLTGAASQYLRVQEEQKELTEKVGSGTWQHESVLLLNSCLQKIEPRSEEISTKVQGRKWFSIFAVLRNKSRGHGAFTTSVYKQICPDLERSIQLIIKNYCLFQRSWVYIHRHLNSKYGLKKLSKDNNAFNQVKSNRSTNLPEGIYVYFDQPVWVELIRSNEDIADFFIPNGAFNGKRFELLSYITGNRIDGDAAPYLLPASQLPSSETQGIGLLDIQGNCFGNLPPKFKNYIQREILELELSTILKNDRHPVITLHGRGGIGKTSLALKVLHDLADDGMFAAIIWFSARDIDLLAEGPKFVQQQILTIEDIAKEFVRLIEPKNSRDKGFIPRDYLQEALRKSPENEPFIEGRPLLFVFDNFETVDLPIALFKWIDTFIRIPNKVLITTRFRDFKGDYPIEVKGMSELECDELIETTASELGIRDLLTNKYQQDLYHESEGHPYVVKVLLGEVAKARRAVKIERIIAGRDEILDALFERTFGTLSPTAKRVFLTLCSWRSTIPKIAVEAVLMRPDNDRMNVEDAVEELKRSSFIEVSGEEEEEFLTVPLVAAVFGQKVLTVSPIKNAVEADTAFLEAFGSTRPADAQRGVDTALEKLFRFIGKTVSQKPEQLAKYLPILEFIARKHYPAQLLLASLHEESASGNNIENAKLALKRYLESAPVANQLQAWQKLATLCSFSRDWLGEVQALLEICQLPNAPFEIISNAADRFNFYFRENYGIVKTDEKQIMVKRLADKMGKSLEELIRKNDDEVTATDCSRLAWLNLHLKRTEDACYYAGLGLDLDRYNHHCLNLARRLADHCPELDKRLSKNYSSNF